jgi:triosephosphate isomerase (TIM)
MRLPLIAGNWKMNTTVNEAVELVKEMRPQIDRIPGVEKVVCPPFISLVPVKEALVGSTIALGAQNMYFMEKGAYTGEVSPLMLADLCEYVIIGHSERRQYFFETEESVDKKVRAALKAGLKPIMCIGETAVENEAGKTAEVLTRQLSLISPDYFLRGTVIAYEPIWAIGTGKAATAAQANTTIGFIRERISQQTGQEAAQKVRLLYGGSVAAGNIAELMRQSEIDGALVGGVSLKAAEFASLVRLTAENKRQP